MFGDNFHPYHPTPISVPEVRIRYLNDALVGAISLIAVSSRKRGTDKEGNYHEVDDNSIASESEYQ